MNSSELFLSLLPWKIDCNSDEARELEERIIENIRFTVNNAPMRSVFCDKIRKFFVKNVWSGQKPLDVKKKKKKKI